MNINTNIFDSFDKIFNYGFNNSPYVYTKIYKEKEENVITCGTKESVEYVLKVPGYNHNTIGIRIKDNLLEVIGEVKNEKSEVVRNFKREQFLDDNIDVSRTKAEVKDGILTLTFFNKEEEQQEWFKVIVE